MGQGKGFMPEESKEDLQEMQKWARRGRNTRPVTNVSL